MKTAVFFDLDSTLADTRHRHGLIHEERWRTDWDAYSLACADDEPMPAAVELARVLHEAGVTIVVLSGRSAVARPQTLEWLERHEVPYDDLLLREEGMKESHGPYKAGRLVEWSMQHPEVEVRLMVDDWPEVREALAQVGVPTLIARPDYDHEVEVTSLK